MALYIFLMEVVPAQRRLLVLVLLLTIVLDPMQMVVPESAAASFTMSSASPVKIRVAVNKARGASTR